MPGQALAVAQSPGNCTGAQRCTGTLKGEVVLEGGGVPAGATVFLQPIPEPRPLPTGEYIVSDSDISAQARGYFHGVVDTTGKVTLSDIRPGRYIPVIQVPGYISPESYGSAAEQVVADPSAPKVTPNFVTVHAGEVVHFHLYLRHGGSITGMVRSQDGRPAPSNWSDPEGIALTLLTRKADGTVIHAAGLGASHSDAVGRFTFADLPPGDYIVMTVIPGPMVKTPQGDFPTMGGFIFSGGTSSLKQASVISVTGTENEKTELVLPTSGLCNVYGRVLAADGSPPRNGLVRLRPVDDEASGTSSISEENANIAEDGSFRFDSILPNRYEAWVELKPEVTLVGVDPDREGVRIRSTPPAPYVSPHIVADLTSGMAKSVVLQLKSGDSPHP